MRRDFVAPTRMVRRGLTGAILTVSARHPRAINRAVMQFAGRPLLDRLLATLRACCASVVVVAESGCRPCRKRGLAVHSPDKILGRSTLAALYTALRAAQTEHVFVCVAAMPLANEPLIRYLATFAEGADAVVPCSSRGPQLTHAIYSRRLIPLLERQLVVGVREIDDFIKTIDPWMVAPDEVAAVDPTGLALFEAAITSHDS